VSDWEEVLLVGDDAFLAEDRTMVRDGEVMHCLKYQLQGGCRIGGFVDVQLDSLLDA
jgi:hypothetical protein